MFPLVEVPSSATHRPELKLFDKQISVGEQLLVRALHSLTNFEV